ncbi:MAG: thioredoxin [Candidatus Cloacimonetes bacterium]|nr:thioredoxin [Candidatus Cloacimonadota bacterium]
MKEISTANFKEIIAEGITVVDFWAPWCGPCRMLTPPLEELSEEMPNVKFVKLNIDNNPEVAMEYGVMSIPTIIFFKDGEQKDTQIGVIPKEKIKNKLDKVM